MLKKLERSLISKFLGLKKRGQFYDFFTSAWTPYIRSIWISVSVFATGGFVVFALIPSTIFMFVEDWTFFEAFYYCVITLTTIGFGDYTPDYTSTNQFINTVYRLASMIWGMTVLQKCTFFFTTFFDYFFDQIFNHNF